jgi:membrane-bound lytic murein transglycosylase B
LSRARPSALALVSGSLVVTLCLAAAGAVWWTRVTPPPIQRYDPQLLRVAATPKVAPEEASRGGTRERLVVDRHWLSTTARATGIPRTAMRAYAVAELRMRTEAPACKLGWVTLAGIGYVESLHGTIGGRTLAADGHSEPPILGPALNGKGKVAAIPATSQSAQWHGDAVWDHAVGPLQFLPSTWATWGADGDRDGVKDPNDLDDAVVAAARYLCADGHSLEGTGWGEAVYSYNHSNAYVRSVYDAASTYAAATN